MVRNRRHVDDVATLLSLHVRKRGGDAVENIPEIDVDHAFPIIDFQALERIRVNVANAR